MKKLISIFAFLLIFAGCTSKLDIKPSPKVDERTELLSIVFQLAGASEYAYTEIKSYAEDIKTYFENYKDHELIKWIPELREEYGIGYDAVASYAIHLKIKNGKISFLENIDIEAIDQRWTKETAELFLEKLNDFYTTTNFNAFYKQHQSLYSTAEKNFEDVLNLIDFNWFENFYGVRPNGNFNLILSLTNGRGNYGPSINYTNGKNDIYAILSTDGSDNSGNPVYSDYVVELIIHEFNHSFCNSLIEDIYDNIKDQAEALFAYNPELFAEQAYGDPGTIMKEMLVRACVIQYYKSIEDYREFIPRVIAEEKRNGFLWIDKLCEKLDEYEANKDKYASLKSFMPEIEKFITSLSTEDIINNYKTNVVRITGTSIPNGATNVDPKTRFVTVYFDKPMYTVSCGTSTGKRGRDFSPTYCQDDNKTPDEGWNKINKKEWTFCLELKPDTEYSISFPDIFFLGENMEPVAETYYLDFRTGK